MKFSVIIPIYNAEKYINDAIESVLKQSLYFKQNIEIILVDDGSTDQSQEICQKYTNKYPENIKYFYQENSGPGSARNTGLDLISSETEYIGFLDADDLLSEDTLEQVNLFFDDNPSIQLAVIPLYHFEKIDTPHRLNYRFKQGNRVIDITKEYKAIHFHIGGCFFRAKNFKANKKLRFNPDLKFWEDALLINTFLLHNKKYGVISGPKYYYRKRAEEDSLVNTAWYQKARYTKMLRSCYLKIADESKVLYGEIIPYVQFLLIYHMRLYLLPQNNEIIFEVLNEQEQKEFFHEFVDLLKQISDKYIIEQDIAFYYKNYLLNLKKNGWPYKQNTNNFLNKVNLIRTYIISKIKKIYLELSK